MTADAPRNTSGVATYWELDLAVALLFLVLSIWTGFRAFVKLRQLLWERRTTREQLLQLFATQLAVRDDTGAGGALGVDDRTAPTYAPGAYLNNSTFPGRSAAATGDHQRTAGLYAMDDDVALKLLQEDVRVREALREATPPIYQDRRFKTVALLGLVSIYALSRTVTLILGAFGLVPMNGSLDCHFVTIVPACFFMALQTALISRWSRHVRDSEMRLYARDFPIAGHAVIVSGVLDFTEVIGTLFAIVDVKSSDDDDGRFTHLTQPHWNMTISGIAGAVYAANGLIFILLGLRLFWMWKMSTDPIRHDAAVEAVQYEADVGAGGGGGGSIFYRREPTGIPSQPAVDSAAAVHKPQQHGSLRRHTLTPDEPRSPAGAPASERQQSTAFPADGPEGSASHHHHHHHGQPRATPNQPLLSSGDEHHSSGTIALLTAGCTRNGSRGQRILGVAFVFGLMCFLRGIGLLAFVLQHYHSFHHIVHSGVAPALALLFEFIGLVITLRLLMPPGTSEGDRDPNFAPVQSATGGTEYSSIDGNTPSFRRNPRNAHSASGDFTSANARASALAAGAEASWGAGGGGGGGVMPVSFGVASSGSGGGGAASATQPHQGGSRRGGGGAGPRTRPQPSSSAGTSGHRGRSAWAGAHALEGFEERDDGEPTSSWRLADDDDNGGGAD